MPDIAATLQLIIDLLHHDDPDHGDAAAAWARVGAHLTGPLIGAKVFATGELREDEHITYLNNLYPAPKLGPDQASPQGFPLETDEFTSERYTAAERHGAFRGSDAMPMRLWRATPSYGQLKRALGVERLLLFPLGLLAGPRHRLLLLGRDLRDFTVSEIETARRVHPLLLGLDQHLRRLGDQLVVSSSLSARELSVLAHWAEGLPAAAIGRRLGISEGTVRTHLLRIRNKTGVRNQAQLLATARALGLVD